MQTTIQELLNRRCVRSFKSETLPEEVLDQVLACGAHAPSGLNKAPIKLVLVNNAQDDATVRKLNQEVRGGVKQDMYYGAPHIIVALGDPNSPTYVYDGACAMDHMLIAAHALDLGACWIHNAKEMFETPQGKALLKKWQLDENLVGIAAIAIGYADNPQYNEKNLNKVYKV